MRHRSRPRHVRGLPARPRTCAVGVVAACAPAAELTCVSWWGFVANLASGRDPSRGNRVAVNLVEHRRARYGPAGTLSFDMFSVARLTALVDALRHDRSDHRQRASLIRRSSLDLRFCVRLCVLVRAAVCGTAFRRCSSKEDLTSRCAWSRPDQAVLRLD